MAQDSDVFVVRGSLQLVESEMTNPTIQKNSLGNGHDDDYSGPRLLDCRDQMPSGRFIRAFTDKRHDSADRFRKRNHLRRDCGDGWDNISSGYNRNSEFLEKWSKTLLQYLFRHRHPANFRARIIRKMGCFLQKIELRFKVFPTTW